MALPQMLEGTWEEIKQHEAELSGQRLRVYINPDLILPTLAEEKVQEEPKQGEQPRKLKGYGMFAHVPGGSEEFALEKQKEIEREDRKFR